MTVGGFWNIAKTRSKLNEHDGVSMVIANTQKAIDIIECVKLIAKVEEYPVETAIKGNAALGKNACGKARKNIIQRS